MAYSRRDFRRWLTDKLKETNFAIYPNEDVDTTAARMGIDPELLRKAQEEKSIELLQDGLTPRLIGTGRTLGKPVIVYLRCPEVVHAAMGELCESKHISTSELLRAIIYTMLSGPKDPDVMDRRWFYRGEFYQLHRSNKGVWRWVIETMINHGADAALRLRAQRVGASKLMLVRGAVTDFLEGRTRELKFIPLSAMWEDPRRYWIGKDAQK